MTAQLAGRRALVAGEGAIADGIAARLSEAGAWIVRTGATSPAREEPVDILVVDLLPPPSPVPLEALEDGAFRTALATVEATARLMAATFPRLSREGTGRVILIGHRYGTATSEGIASYNAAAWALHGLMRSAAVEWARVGITTNLVLPLAETPELAAARTRRPAIIDRMVSQLPLARAGDPVRDIGGAVLYLASDRARFVNGQVLHADGGQHIAGPVLSPARFG